MSTEIRGKGVCECPEMGESGQHVQRSIGHARRKRTAHQYQKERNRLTITSGATKIKLENERTQPFRCRRKYVCIHTHTHTHTRKASGTMEARQGPVRGMSYSKLT